MGFHSSSNQEFIKLNLGSGCEFKEDYIDVDCDTYFIEHHDKRANLVVADIMHLPFANSCVDEVLCSQILEHFIPKELKQVLLEIDRVLKIGGRLVSSTPYLPNILSKQFINFEFSSTPDSATRISHLIYGEDVHARGLHKCFVQPIFFKTWMPNYDFNIIEIRGTILYCEGIKQC